MTKMRLRMVALLWMVAAGVSAGCSSTQPSIPSEFCKAPVDKASLSPLIPNGGSIDQQYNENQAQPGAACKLSVGGNQILFVEIARWDRDPEPVDWDTVGSQYKHAAKRDVSFPGHASIGSDRAIVRATCNTSAAYMSFMFFFSGDRVEDTSSGYKKLQHFINDFVPRQTARYKCTE
ncbi:hypothetical protein [Streptomyces sp. NPDC018693]|uniref:hypothetical protein n=1 Tax=unclassified Streptomyces TaxID=2593676 RepID=UPI0037A34771